MMTGERERLEACIDALRNEYQKLGMQFDVDHVKADVSKSVGTSYIAVDDRNEWFDGKDLNVIAFCRVVSPKVRSGEDVRVMALRIYTYTEPDSDHAKEVLWHGFRDKTAVGYSVDYMRTVVDKERMHILRERGPWLDR